MLGPHAFQLVRLNTVQKRRGDWRGVRDEMPFF